MLTLFETINAIKTLDTELDIIRNACQKILKPGETPDRMTAEQIAIEIATGYTDKTDGPNTLLVALAMALTSTAIVVAIEGKELEMLRTIHDVINDLFIEMFTKRLEKKFEGKPELMFGALIKLMEDIVKMKAPKV